MLKHSVKLFEMGSSHIQPAWESNNNNKKSGRGGGEARLLPFLSAGADSPGSEGGRAGRAVRGRAGAAGAAPCGGGTSPPLPSPPGGGQDWGAEGARGRGREARSPRLLRYLCGPRPGSYRWVLGSGGSFLGPPRTGLHLLRRILNGESVRSPGLSAVPSARRPRGSRILYL